MQDILHKHGHAQTAFLGIMNEFWQTNAIFTAFTALALGGIVTNWRQFADAHYSQSLFLTTYITALMVVWMLSLKKGGHSRRHQKKLEEGCGCWCR